MYAHERGVNMIPMMLAADYKPNGWLGMLLGARLWYGFFGPTLEDEEAFESEIAKLCRELGPPEAIAPKISEGTPPAKAASTSSPSAAPLASVQSAVSASTPTATPEPEPEPEPEREPTSAPKAASAPAPKPASTALQTAGTIEVRPNSRLW